jgi:tetratricopeptide (TPR) repeat protein
VYFTEGRLDEAVEAIHRANEHTDPPPPPWTVSWLSGTINRQQGRLDEAIENFETVLTMRTAETVRRKFDFSLDYEVINLLGQTLFDRGRQIRDADRKAERDEQLRAAVAQFQKTLTIDSENVAAHYNLGLLYTQLGNEQQAAHHKELHAKYKPDDNARDKAIAAARKKYPAANFAAESLVIYPLQRAGAPGLPPEAIVPQTARDDRQSGEAR